MDIARLFRKGTVLYQHKIIERAGWGQGGMRWRKREAARKRIQVGFGYVELEIVGFLVVTWVWKLEACSESHGNTHFH